MKYIFPLFKFLSRRHANSLLTRGQVRLATLFEFRDKERYSGLIYDNNEGGKILSVYFDHIEGTGDELGRFGMPFQGEGMYYLCDTTINLCQDHNDCYIYSTTTSFFSSMLIQAIKDDKDACVMIWQPTAFFLNINEVFWRGVYMGIHPCVYGDREIKLTWNEHKEYINILSAIPASVIKPAEHAVYKEARAIWLANGADITPAIVESKTLSDCVVEIIFDDLDLEIVLNRTKGSRLGVQVIKKNGKSHSVFSIAEPCEVFTPVIADIDGVLFIGFKPESETSSYMSPHIENAHTGIAVTEIGILFCLNRLDEVSHLRYFSQSA